MRERIRTLAPSPKRKVSALKAEGRITRADGRYRLELSVREGEVVGERTIESESCADLGGAAAVALGLLLNSDAPLDEAAASSSVSGSTKPGSSSSSSAPTGENAANSASENGAQTTEAPKPAAPQQPLTDSTGASETDTARTGPSFHLVLRLPMAAVDVGPLPSPSLNFGGAIGVQKDVWRFFVGARVSLRQRIWSNDLTGYGADIGRAVGEISACRGWEAQRFELAPCVHVSAQLVSAEGFGEFITSKTARTVGFGGGVGVTGTWRPTEWLGLFLGAAGTIEASRPHISIEGFGEVYQLGPAVLTLGVGSEWIFL